MPAVSFDVSVGDHQARSGGRGSSWYLRSLRTEVGMGGVGHATIVVAAASASPPEDGQAVRIQLDGVTVFSGRVLGVRTTPDALVISSADGLAVLARLEVERVYLEMTAGGIAKDILKTAKLEAGAVNDGPKFKSYVLQRGPRAMRHLELLAERAGFSLFSDGAGRIHFAAPKVGREDHVLQYATQVLSIELARETPAFDGTVVWGEGAAGERGANRAHWLVTKLSSLNAKAAVDSSFNVLAGKAGEYPLTVRDGTVRAAGDAADRAKARMTALAARKVRGFVEVVGNASIAPDSLLKLDGIPKDHPASSLASGQPLWVRRVCHTLSASNGFVTRVEL